MTNESEGWPQPKETLYCGVNDEQVKTSALENFHLTAYPQPHNAGLAASRSHDKKNMAMMKLARCHLKKW